MNLEVITDGLRKLLEENNYNIATINFYEREWKEIQKYLIKEYGNTAFEMERGLAYLEYHYEIIKNYNNGSLSQQRVQLIRVIHMLEDYRLHQVLTRRYHASKNPIKLTEHYSKIISGYLLFLRNSELSQSTIHHYQSIAIVFMDYLTQKKIYLIKDFYMDSCNGYLKTLAGFSFKTIEQNICGLRHFLRYLFGENLVSQCFAEKIHMPSISKKAHIPSTWKLDELRKMIGAINRDSPIGKRDYAMIIIACVLGLRVGDIKNLRFENFNWNEKKLSIIQQKTHKALSLPLPDSVGWAVIDYIKNGRPIYYDTDIIFLKHMPPFDAFSDNNHLERRIIYYMNKVGITLSKDKHSGFHSLRHSAGSMLLDMETPLPVIATILGHSDMNSTSVYLKMDLKKLAECVLPMEGFDYDES